MQCPYCHSEVPEGTKICPVCHGDVEAELVRLRGADAFSRPAPLADEPAPQQGAQARQAPYAQPAQDAPQGYGQAQGYQPHVANGPSAGRGASAPGVQQPLRNFDTGKMGSGPKWPIVLIAVLVLVIIAIVAVLVFNFARRSPDTQTHASLQVSAASSQSETASSDAAGQSATDAAQPNAAAGDQQAELQPQATDDQQAYTTLDSAYQSALAFNDQISALAGRFNAEDLLHADLATRTAARDEAAAALAQISDISTAVSGLTLAEGSAYQDVRSTLITVYTDLYNRMNVLVESLQASVDAGDDPAAADGTVSEILSADNGADGVNIYKAEYDSLIDAAQPAAPAA